MLSIYDKSVEYISGGSNVPEIKEFFWKWRREHQPHVETNLGRCVRQSRYAGSGRDGDLGVFGGLELAMSAETPER